MLPNQGVISQNSSATRLGLSSLDPQKSTISQIESSPGYSAVSITSALDSSREYSRPSTANESIFTTNTAHSMALKSSKSDASIVRTLMTLNSISPPGWGNTPRNPSAVGSVSRLATAHGDKHQAAQFKTATNRAQTEGPRTLAQVHLHLGSMRQRASDISKDYSKLTCLSSLLTLQRQYNIALQNLESENKMILTLVDKIIQGGSAQKVLSAIKQLKPIMEMMQSPLFDRMPFARFAESCTDHVREEIQSICSRLSETSKQQVHASAFIPWNTDPSETWVSDKASLLTEVIDQQLDAVGDEILGDVMKLYDVNQKLTRMCLRLQGENDILKQKMSEVISKIPDRKEQRSILKSMDMPVLNDDPNSHDLLRPVGKLPSMSGTSSSPGARSTSTRADVGALSMNGLLYTAKAASDFKSLLGSSGE